MIFKSRAPWSTLTGVAAIGNRMSSQPFNCEISNPKIRSFTGCIWFISYSSGQCSIYLLASFVTWRLAISITLIPLIISTLGMVFMHESPIWLLRQGQIGKAKLSLKFYDRSETETKEEIESILEIMTMGDFKQATKHETLVHRFKMKLDMMRKPTFFKPCLYLIVALSTMEWSCFPFLSSYMVSIFKVSWSLLL